MNKKKILIFIILLFFITNYGNAETVRFPIPKVSIGVTPASRPSEVAVTLEILALLSIITMAPAFVLMLTSFLRILIVYSFVSRALATQQMPPYQVITTLSLFLTIFIMAPTFKKINDNALQPYFRKEIDIKTCYKRGIQPIREFMFKQTREKDIALFIYLAKLKRPKNRSEVPTYILIPAFMISELTTAFKMGILIFIPFIIIDIVVASTLMSMGMIMLPPVMISLPLKILLFVLIDGWHLLTYSIVNSFK